MSFKKEISILGYIAKKLQAQQFCLSGKSPGSKIFICLIFFFFNILKTVLVIDLTF